MVEMLLIQLYRYLLGFPQKEEIQRKKKRKLWSHDLRIEVGRDREEGNREKLMSTLIFLIYLTFSWRCMSIQGRLRFRETRACGYDRS